MVYWFNKLWKEAKMSWRSGQAFLDAIAVCNGAGTVKPSDITFQPKQGFYIDDKLMVEMNYYDVERYASLDVRIRVPSGFEQVMVATTGEVIAFRDGHWCDYLRDVAREKGEGEAQIITPETNKTCVDDSSLFPEYSKGGK